MPGPGSRKSKSNKKPKPARGNTPDDYIGDIDNAEGWHLIVLSLCDVFELPDLTTRSGLKKVHADFEKIYQRLDQAYEKHKDSGRMRGGIVGIYAKLCADSILRNKLFERGFLTRLFPLLKIPHCRHLALRSLSNVTHHGGEAIRVDIAKHTDELMQSFEENPDDMIGAEHIVTTLAHSLGAVATGDESPTKKNIMRTIDVPKIIRLTTAALKKPGISQYMMDHASELLTTLTVPSPESCLKSASTTGFFVAGLRSKDWSFRCTCLGGIMQLREREAEEDLGNLDPNYFLPRLQRGFPPHISQLLSNYGAERCETSLMVTTSLSFQRAMMKCAQDHDLYSLGIKMAGFIVQTEYAIADGAFQGEDPRTGKLEIIDLGLPFKMWADSLPHCAKVLREKGSPADLDKADILDIKYAIMKRRIPDAVVVANQGIKRNPQCAYFYYAISMAVNDVAGLKAAKKGMKCTQTTPFVRYQLMQRAVEHAGYMGQSLLRECGSHTENRKWEEGIAFLMSALEDAKTFVNEAPPDHRQMRNVLSWFIVLTITVQGPQITPDLAELRSKLQRLKITQEIFTFMSGKPSPRTRLRLSQETITDNYATAIKEWGDIIAAKDSGLREKAVSSEKAEDDLAAWLDDIHLDSGDQEPRPQCGNPKVNSNHVALYKCSWCNNPSAVLRKCSGCGVTRYCDAGCQKSHWSDHKKHCLAKTKV